MKHKEMINRLNDAKTVVGHHFILTSRAEN